MALARSLYRLALRSPAIRLLNNSRAGARSYAGWLGIDPARVAILPNGLDQTDPISPEQCRAMRQSLGIAPDVPLIAGVLRLGPEKRPDLFVDVLERLPGVQGVIAGDGPLRDEVQAHIERRGLSRRMRLLGIRTDAAAVMGAADVVLHVSDAEGLPNTVLEAQALGRPVVATRAGGTGEAVSDGLRPFLRAIGDAQGLAEACRHLLDDPALARDLGAAARRDVLARFTFDAMLEALMRGVNEPWFLGPMTTAGVKSAGDAAHGASCPHPS